MCPVFSVVELRFWSTMRIRYSGDMSTFFNFPQFHSHSGRRSRCRIDSRNEGRNSALFLDRNRADIQSTELGPLGTT